MTSHPARHLPPTLPSPPLCYDRDRVQVYLFRVATNKSLRKQRSNQSQIKIDCRRGAKSKQQEQRQQQQQQIGGECNPNRIVGAPSILLLLLFPPFYTLCCTRHKVLSAAGRVDFRFRFSCTCLISRVPSLPLSFTLFLLCLSLSLSLSLAGRVKPTRKRFGNRFLVARQTITKHFFFGPVMAQHDVNCVVYH